MSDPKPGPKTNPQPGWAARSLATIPPVRYTLECTIAGCDGYNITKPSQRVGKVPIHDGFYSTKDQALSEARFHAARFGHPVLVREEVPTNIVPKELSPDPEDV